MGKKVSKLYSDLRVESTLFSRIITVAANYLHNGTSQHIVSFRSYCIQVIITTRSTAECHDLCIDSGCLNPWCFPRKEKVDKPNHHPNARRHTCSSSILAASGSPSDTLATIVVFTMTLWKGSRIRNPALHWLGAVSKIHLHVITSFSDGPNSYQFCSQWFEPLNIHKIDKTNSVLHKSCMNRLKYKQYYCKPSIISKPFSPRTYGMHFDGRAPTGRET